MKRITFILPLLLAALIGHSQEQPLSVRQKNFSDSIAHNYGLKVQFDQLQPKVKVLKLTTSNRFASFDEFSNYHINITPLLKRIAQSYAAVVLQNPELKDMQLNVYFMTDTQLGAFRLYQ